MNNIKSGSTSSSEGTKVNTINNYSCLWLNLPNELFIRIAKHLGSGDLRQINFVCKHWHALMQLPEFMRKFKLIINRYNVAELHEIIRNNKNFSEEHAIDTVEIQDLQSSNELRMILRSLGAKMSKLYLSDSPILGIVNDCLPDLEEITVKQPGNINCKSVSSDIQYLNLNRKATLKIEKLCIETCREDDDYFMLFLQSHSESLKQLEIDILNHPTKISEWAETFAMFKHIEVLKITGQPRKPWISSILHALPKETPLQHLCLKENSLSEEITFVIDNWSKSLTNLELIDCYDLSNNVVQNFFALRHTLRHLTISSPIEDILQGIALETNNTLKTLVYKCPSSYNMIKLCILFERLPHLTFLSLEGHAYGINNMVLSNICRHQINLQHLNLDYCTNLTDAGLIGFGSSPAPITNLKYLQSLTLRVCMQITDLPFTRDFKFMELRKLEITLCPNISSEGIKEIVKHCVSLEDLTFSMCKLINDDSILHIAQGLPRLRRLNVDGCRLLTVISIYHVMEHCKFLKELTLLHIRTLEDWKKFLKNNTLNSIK